MNIIDIINKKRLGKILTEKEIEYVVNGYVNGNIPDYQMSSLLMAIVLKGMTEHEIITLTKYMLNSGERIDLSGLEHVVDKHSTGGVGDKTTLIIGPIVASLGCSLAKMSGKGLGHTGGTIDKLESIPKFRVNLSDKEFIDNVKKIGISIVSQTSNLVPADKKIYALRDVTGTVESNALIASSIMSKKIASGSKNLVIDIKVGKGALIKTKKDAKELAKLMIKIGKAHDMKVICILSNMDIPLGNNIGNSLEVQEVIDVLKNNKNGNLRDLCIELSSYMASLGLNISYKEAKNKVLDSLESGKAYKKFREFVRNQGGNTIFLPKSRYTYEVKSNQSGYINNIDALFLGQLSMKLGAGRESLNDNLDYGAGIVLNKNLGDYVKKDETIMTLHTNKKIDYLDDTLVAFKIEKKRGKHTDLIYDIIS